MNFKKEFAEQIGIQLKENLSDNKIYEMIEKPKYEYMGDLAFPCFELAKIYKKPPQQIAASIAAHIKSGAFEKVEAAGGYVNVFLNQEMAAAQVLTEILSQKDHYGDLALGKGETITYDLSSPNIAKPFSMGHLRSTVIGNAVANLSEKCGYKAVRINHIGDWGTQFGKLIAAYKMWGEDERIKKDPIAELLKLYVKFHEEAEKDPGLNNEGRRWFKELENGNEEARHLWKWFRDESLEAFNKIYELLGIRFDAIQGEAFYNDKMASVVEELKEKQLLEESNGAQVVTLEDLPPCLIKKNDGTTLYATRDLAAAIYRYQTYHFSKSLYVVGNEQTLHFKQLKLVLKKMGYRWAEEMHHIPFGMILKDGKKMSTRKGKIVQLEDVIKEAISMAKANIDEKNPGLEAKDEVARQVGTGAVIFHDLKNDRMHDIEFSLDSMLKFEGDTAPYIQYTHARAASLLRKGDYEARDTGGYCDDPGAWPVVIQLMAFPETVESALQYYDPSQLARYILDLSKAFNKYYAQVKILSDVAALQARLDLVYAVKTVLKEGLRLLGVEAPEEM